MLEKTVEAYLVERVRALGGEPYKFTSPARASVPDRIVVLPPGRVYFIEVKRPGGKLTRGQEREHEHLRRLGADVRVLDSIGAINAFVNEVQAVAAPVAPAAPVAEYDGNHVQNHCTECNEHEAECSCDQAVAADGAALSDAAILAKAKPRVYSPRGSEIEYYDFSEQELISFVRDCLSERAAVSPATADGLSDSELALLVRIKHFHTHDFGRGAELHADAITDAYKKGRASQAAAPADAREPVATFDDGLKVYLDSWTGGRHEAGSFGEVTLRFTDERQTTVREYRAKDIVPADVGEAVASEKRIAELTKQVAHLRAVATEYNDLICHMCAAGDFHEFMADRKQKREDAAAQGAQGGKGGEA
ncbi:hypothetical protein B7759_02112 [Burkholderia glumae]|uniref:VRR-NUC domain-containing protein n=1 Tax=Burkholderia glumae TaxID=337 RepID=UPI001AE342BE|nr:VRR-NUC domain-containing protein [Burkholderia glumae]QTP33518.1 hypothetical protein B7759_02112 [Burkholderia glumae]